MTKVKTYCWLALPVAGCWVTAQTCQKALGADLKRPGGSISVTKSALEVSIHETRYTNRRLTFFALLLGYFNVLVLPEVTESAHLVLQIGERIVGLMKQAWNLVHR